VLSVKKKKNLNVGKILIVWLVTELVHNRLAMSGNVIKNYGISFGINGVFFILLNIIFVLLITTIWTRQKLYGLSLLVVGGWINLVDRIIFGYVRDYWQLGWVYNNLADWLIAGGVLIILFELLWEKR
jgi:lipoprotein signal peptidase